MKPLGSFDDPETRRRLLFAEETCWVILLAIDLQGLETVDLGWRQLIAEPLQQWADIAAPSPRDLPRRPRWSSSANRR